MDLHSADRIIQVINFRSPGSLQHFYHDGFSAPEEVGTWSLGLKSSINIPISGNYCGLSVGLRVQPCIIEGLNTSQCLTISIGGVRTSTYWAVSSDWVDITFDLPGTVMIPDTGLTVIFEHPLPVTPASANGYTDTRSLGFMFETFCLKGRGAEKKPAEPSVKQDSLAPDTSEVQQGADGWLFLTGGSNDVWRYYSDPNYFTSDHAERWSNLIRSRAAKLEALGIRYLHIAAPDKISVYPEYFGKIIPNLDGHPIRLLHMELNRQNQTDLLINPLNAFSVHQDRDRLYLKTDTHWTYIAGQTVLRLVTERLGFPRSVNMATRTVMYYDLIWDLGSKVSPQISERNFAVTTLASVSRVYENDLAAAFRENMRSGKPGSHGSIYVHFRNTAHDAIAKTVVIFGDSFMDFQDSNTSVIFAENFRDVHFVWSPNIDYVFVRTVGADIVITELAERFMISIPNDEYTVRV